MSENNNSTKQQKVYVPGTSAKEFVFSNGDSVIKLGFNLAKLAPFIKEHKNANGYINIDIFKRKEVGPYGDTHSLVLNQYVPNKDKSAPSKKTSPAKSKKVEAPVESDPDIDI